MQVRYSTLAQRLVEICCESPLSGARSLPELLDLLGADDPAVAHVLTEDVRGREARLLRLSSAMNRLSVEYEDRRMRPPFAESAVAPGSYIFEWRDQSADQVELRNLKARLRLQPTLLALLRGMDSHRFEELCGCLLHLAGCVGIDVTEIGPDNGLDFTARLPVSSSQDPELNAFFRIAGSLSFFIYGQAKRYARDNPVDNAVVQALEGSWRALRNAYGDGTAAPAQRAALVKAAYRMADPVVLLVATTSRFTPPALRNARDLGVITLDGEQLAQLMLESNFGVEHLAVANYQVSAKALEAAIDATREEWSLPGA